MPPFWMNSLRRYKAGIINNIINGNACQLLILFIASSHLVSLANLRSV